MSLFDATVPEGAAEYRGWSIWYDFGHYQHGIIYRETTWRGSGPAGEQIACPTRGPGEPHQDGHAWLKAEIDRRTVQ